MRTITQCPVCDAAVQVTELSCTRCETKLHGTFPPAPLAQLPRENQEFIETFVLCRGVIREVEMRLGISYPTVRARLDAAVRALEAVTTTTVPVSPLPPTPPLPPIPVAAEPVIVTVVTQDEPAHNRDAQRREVLAQIESGILTPEEGAAALRKLSR